jgi:hypothetical protein
MASPSSFVRFLACCLCAVAGWSAESVVTGSATSAVAEPNTAGSLALHLEPAPAAPIAIGFTMTGSAIRGDDYHIARQLPLTRPSGGPATAAISTNAPSRILVESFTSTGTTARIVLASLPVATDTVRIANLAPEQVLTFGSDVAIGTTCDATLANLSAAIAALTTQGVTPQAITSATTLPSGAGISDVVLQIDPIDDLLGEGEENIQLEVGLGAGYTLGSPAFVSTTIADNEPEATIASGTAATEGGANGSFTLNVGIGTLSLPVTLKLDFSTGSGFATPVTDFTVTSSSGVTTWSDNILTIAGITTSATTLTVAAVDDLQVENEVVRATLMAYPSGRAQLGSPAAATTADLAIVDNDPTVSLATVPARDRATEGGATGMVRLSFLPVAHAAVTVGLSQPSVGGQVTAAPTTQSLVGDWIGPTGVTLTHLIPGRGITISMGSSTAAVSDATGQDPVSGTADARLMLLRNPAAGDTVTITDDDSAATVTGSVHRVTLTFRTTPVGADDIAIAPNRPSQTMRNLIAKLQTLSSNDLDLDVSDAQIPNSIPVPMNVATLDLEVEAIDDVDAAEAVQKLARLQIAAGTGYARDSSDTADLTIVDNEPGVSLIRETISAAEGDVAHFRIDLDAAPSATAALALTLPTAGRGIDWDGLPVATITAPLAGAQTVAVAGDVPLSWSQTVAGNATTSAAVQIILLQQPVQNQQLHIGSLSSLTVGQEDIKPTLAETLAALLAKLSGVTTSTVGRANAVFLPADAQTLIQFDLDLLRDVEVESDEALTVSVANGNGYRASAQASATTIITDNSPVVSLGPATSAIEGARGGWQLDCDRSNSMTYAVGFAITGTAQRSLSGVTDPDFEMLPVITLTGAGSATMASSADPDGTRRILTDAANKRIIIASLPHTDDTVDVGAIRFTFGTSTGAIAIGTTATEAARNLSASIRAVQPTGLDVADLNPGTVIGAIPIPPGTRHIPIDVIALDDGVVESLTPELATLDLQPPTAPGTMGYRLGALTTAQVEITDKDVPVVSLAAVTGSSTAAEPIGADTATGVLGRVQLSFSSPTSAPTVVTFSTTGTATRGTDYVILPTIPLTLPSAATQVTTTNADGRILAYATGSSTQAYLTLAALPSETDTVTIGGTTFGFTTSATSATAVGLATTPRETAINLQQAITAQTSLGVSANQVTAFSAIFVPLGVSSIPIDVEALRDSVNEGSELAVVTITDGVGYRPSATSASSTVTITDPLTRATITTTTASVTEGGSTTIAIALAPTVSVAGDLEIVLSPNDQVSLKLAGLTPSVTGPATSSLPDGLRISGIPSGTTALSVLVTPVDDTTPENDVAVTLSLRAVTGGPLTGSATAAITVRDNDVASYAFAGEPAVVAVAPDATWSYPVQLTKTAGSATAVSMTVAAISGTLPPDFPTGPFTVDGTGLATVSWKVPLGTADQHIRVRLTATWPGPGSETRTATQDILLVVSAAAVSGGG